MVYEGPVSDEEILTDAESFDEEDCGWKTNSFYFIKNLIFNNLEWYFCNE
jgi:hypothetical protein